MSDQVSTTNQNQDQNQNQNQTENDQRPAWQRILLLVIIILGAIVIIWLIYMVFFRRRGYPTTIPGTTLPNPCVAVADQATCNSRAETCVRGLSGGQDTPTNRSVCYTGVASRMRR